MPSSYHRICRLTFDHWFRPDASHMVTVEESKGGETMITTLGTPETVYDSITFGISGPVVVLQGFTVNGALRDNAKGQVENLGWVAHVVQEVELLDVGPELKRVRRQVLATLKKQVPQAFPRNHANIRIKGPVNGDVTLVAVIDAPDEKRFLAAVEQIKHITLVTSVTNNVTRRS